MSSRATAAVCPGCGRIVMSRPERTGIRFLRHYRPDGGYRCAVGNAIGPFAALALRLAGGPAQPVLVRVCGVLLAFHADGAATTAETEAPHAG